MGGMLFGLNKLTTSSPEPKVANSGKVSSHVRTTDNGSPTDSLKKKSILTPTGDTD